MRFKKQSYVRGLLTILLFTLAGFLMQAVVQDGKAQIDKKFSQAKRGKSAHGYIEGEVLVKFKKGVSLSSANRVADSLSLNVKKYFSAISRIKGHKYLHLKSKTKTTQQMLQELGKNPNVVYVSPNYIRYVDTTTPNDTRFIELWGLHNTGQTGGTADVDIDAPEAWDNDTGSSDVIAAVIDTGIDYNHPDLAANIWVNPNEVEDGIDNDGNGFIDDIHGINAITGSGDPMDDNSHGTHCAGTIGAVGNNGQGIVGVNWNVKMIGAKSYDSTGYGSDADSITCIDYIIDLKTNYGQNIVAINASWGGETFNPSLKDAIDAAGAEGIIFCAAAGNDYTDNDVFPHYPSSYDCSNIISVTGVDAAGSQHFNYGAASVDLGAPGVSILSTVPCVYSPQPGDIFFDDMESGASKWTTGGTNNTWAITTDQEGFEDPGYPAPSPPYFWSDSPGADYTANTDSWLMNASDIDLSGYIGQNIYIGFGSAMDIEELPYDHAYVEVSGDSGSTWTILMDFSGYCYYWDTGYSYLIPDAVKTTNFRFRFRLVSDDSVQFAGWLIDDVGIGTITVGSYGSKDGTSMATPHVTGAVALIAARFPSDTAAQRIARILNNTAPLASLNGKCVTGGMLNLAVTMPPTPVANFSGNPTTVAVGSSVQFIDQSTNTPTSWAWTFEGGTPSSNTQQNPIVTYNTPGTFDVTLIASNAQGSDSETKSDYITVVYTSIYCSSQGISQDDEYIGGVQVADLNNTSGPSSYSDFTSMPANMSAGAAVDVTLTPVFTSYAYDEYWKIWIDYNNDGDFEDAGEEVFSDYGTPVINGSFTVQSGVDVVTRMRVSMKCGSYPGPCETFDYGEVEDYTVNINKPKPDFNNDGRADIVWRYYGPGGYNVLWLRGTATTVTSVPGISSEKIKNNPGVGDMGNVKPMEEIGEVADKENMDISIQELRERGIKDGFEEYATAEPDQFNPLSDPFDFDMKKSKSGEAVSHTMAFTVSDPRDVPEAVELPAAVNTDWKLCGTGDFDGDNNVDLVWRNAVNGNNVVWYMDGLTRIGVGWLPATTNLDWTLCCTGDFNGDNNVDLVWRNAVNGNNVVWYMDGLTRIGIGWLPTTVNLDWALCGAGDFNNDGKTDLVWRNVSNGKNAVWFMDGVTMTGVGWLPTTVNLDWTLCGTGDFNNDGKLDLLWRNVGNGNNAIWYMDGLILVEDGAEFLTTVTDTTWEIEN